MKHLARALTLTFVLVAPTIFTGCPVPQPMVTVPDVRELTEASAESSLADVGLILGSVGEGYSDTVAPGLVVSQSPTAGSSVSSGSSVAITVSLGPDPENEFVVVPDLSGFTSEGAESILTDMNLHLGVVTEVHDETVTIGRIFDQTPEAETTVAPDSAIDVTISLGPNPGGEGEGEGEALPPIAGFEATPVVGTIPLPVQFKNQSDANGASTIEYYWDFGDGTESSEANPLHIYDLDGSFNVSLTVTTDGGTDRFEIEGGVLARSASPTFEIGSNISSEESGTVTPEEGFTFEGVEGSPLEGLTVEIEPDSIEQDAFIEIGSFIGTTTSDIGTPSNVGIALSSPDALDTEAILTLAEPASGNEFRLLLEVMSDGTLEPCQFLRRIGGSDTLEYIVPSSGQFTWVDIPLVAGSDTNPQKATLSLDVDYTVSGFSVERSGFQVANINSTRFPDGRCYGFTEFARWFFNEHGPGLSSQLTTILKKDPHEFVLTTPTGQDVVTARAMNSIQQAGIDQIAIILLIHSADDETNFYAIKSMLRFMKSPVSLALMEPQKDGHAVLAYGFDEDSIHIYDPKFPKEPRSIHYNEDSEQWQKYGDWTNIGPIRSFSFRLKESFENILNDARQGSGGFSGNASTTVNMLEPENNSTLTEANVTLRGEVLTNGFVPLSDINVFNTGPQAPVQINGDGTFEIADVPLEFGENMFHFFGQGDIWEGGPGSPGGILRVPVDVVQLRALKLYRPRNLKLSTNTINLSANQPNTELTVSADPMPSSDDESMPLKWSATSEDTNRVTTSPTSGNANSTDVTITVTDTSADFDTTITFRNSDNPRDTVELPVQFRLPKLGVTPTTLTLSSTETSATVNVTNTASEQHPVCWTATPSDERITVSPASGDANSTDVTITATDTSETYSAKVTFTNEDNQDDKVEIAVDVDLRQPMRIVSTMSYLDIPREFVHNLNLDGTVSGDIFRPYGMHEITDYARAIGCGSPPVCGLVPNGEILAESSSWRFDGTTLSFHHSQTQETDAGPVNNNGLGIALCNASPCQNVTLTWEVSFNGTLVSNSSGELSFVGELVWFYHNTGAQVRLADHEVIGSFQN